MDIEVSGDGKIEDNGGDEIETSTEEVQQGLCIASELLSESSLSTKYQDIEANEKKWCEQDGTFEEFREALENLHKKIEIDTYNIKHHLRDNIK